MGMVHPSGPSSQCGTCSAFVQASHTSRRGASTTRTAVTSRSEGVVKVVVRLLLAVAMLLLLLFHDFQVLVEARVARLPEAPVLLGPVRHLLERRRLQPPGAPLRIAAARDQARALQHLEVLGYGGLAHVEGRAQLGHR